jgi:hypothetical protein
MSDSSLRWLAIASWKGEKDEYEIVVECENEAHAMAVVALFEWSDGWVVPIERTPIGTWIYRRCYTKSISEWRNANTEITGAMREALIAAGVKL